MFKPVVERIEIDDSHYYYVDGKFYPSVTKILQESMPTPFALKQWLGEVGNERAEAKLNAAGARGSMIHEACQRWLLGNLTQVDLDKMMNKRDQDCVKAFIDFLAEFQPTAIATEMTVASQLQFAGTLDIYCVRSNPKTGVEEHWIIDLKTSSGVYDSHKLQIIAYQQAFYEMTGIMAKVGILHLNKTKKGYTFHTDLDIAGKPVGIKDFMCVYDMYKMLNGGKIPEPPEIKVKGDITARPEIKIYSDINEII